MDRDGIEVASGSQPITMCSELICSNKVSGNVYLHEPNLWWPWTMSDTPGYLYVFQVKNSVNLLLMRNTTILTSIYTETFLSQSSEMRIPH